MASVSPIQLLPPEVIETVVGYLVEGPDHMSSDKDTLADVKSCALVSTAFGTLCQVHLFRTISYVGFYQMGEKRLMRFVRTLVENPSLVHYVRHITVGFSESGDTRCRLTRPDITQASSTLLQLSNLQSLTILDWSFTFGGRIKLPQRVYALLHQMIEANLSRGTLRSLHTVGLTDLHAPSLLTHKALRELHLGRITLPFSPFSCPHITHLDIYDVDSFDVSVLSQFPHLEGLRLQTRSLIKTPSQHCEAPSFFLRKIIVQLSLSGMTRVFTEFYGGYAHSLGAGPFKHLQELHYVVPYDDQTEALQHILNEATSLKVLEITTGPSESGEILPVTDSLLGRIQLSTKILDIFPNLTKLHIALYLTVYPQAYDSALSQAISLLDSISNRNAIEEFAFILTVQFLGLELPHSEPWSQIGRRLSSPDGFPMLRKVETSLYLETDGETLAMLSENSPNIHDQLPQLTMEAKTVLLERGIKLHSEMYLSER